MGGDSTSPTLNLENWMGSLPTELKDLPLIYLAIPGSHDSMTYGITSSSTLAPDAECALKLVSSVFTRPIINWTRTQSLDAYQQLLIGIRYFDLRLATKEGVDSFFFTHALYADEITRPLTQILEFLDSHPGEVVILDCQHFYGFTAADHTRFIKFLIDLYGHRLVPRQNDLTEITLNSLSRLKQQVVIVYRHGSVLSMSEFWLAPMMPSPWPQTDKVSTLINFLENIKRPATMGFVHQAVLTPTTPFLILKTLSLSNIRKSCAIPVKKKVLPKLRNFSPGPPLSADSEGPAPVNVVIADFVEMDDALFPRAIIELNWKLLRNTTIRT